MTTATQDPPSPSMPGKDAAGAVHQSTAEQEAAKSKENIGRTGEPIRVLTFTAGGIDTAMQLGVTHALLVMDAEAPDVVLGVSAGAVNAVALAEILQAGSPGQSAADGKAAELEPKVARFRQILEDFQNCPQDLIDAMLPDAYQIDAQRPLETLRLPVQAEQERQWRDDGLASRAGLINFYNELLLLKAPIGTITRAIRRVLGLVAARESAPKFSLLVEVIEGFRLWMLTGTVLHRLVPLVRPVSRTAIAWRPWTAAIRQERGVSAGRLIFRSQLWSRIWSLLGNALSLLLLSALWVTVSGVLLWGLVTLIRIALGQLQWPWPDLWPRDNIVARVFHSLTHWTRLTPPSPGELAVLKSLVLTIIVGATLVGLFHKLKLKDRFWPEVGRSLGTAISFLLLLTWWSLVLVALSTAAAYVLRPLLTWAISWAGWSLSNEGAQYIVMASALVVAGALVVTLGVRKKRFLLNLLARYGLADSLLNPHPLRQFFVRVFDPGYYGPVPMDRAVEGALERNDSPYPESEIDSKKYLDHYAKGSPPIRVALQVADVSTGKLSVLDSGLSTVDALMAATAAAPLFPPVRSQGSLYVDGANVANQTTEALMDYLRSKVNQDATAVHVYNVAPLPLSRRELGPPKVKQGTSLVPVFTDLVEVIGRTMQIQRLRDAYLDQKLVNLLSRVLPPGQVRVPYGKDGLLRAWAYPIEPEENLNTARRFFGAADPRERRQVIAETVADGCRAALQTMLAHQVRATSRSSPQFVTPGREGEQTVWCGAVVADHKRHKETPEEHLFPGSAPRPDDKDKRTPGLVEVCRHCALYRGSDGDQLERRLVVLKRKPAPPDWYIRDRTTTEQAAQTPEARVASEDPGAPTPESSETEKKLWPVTRTWPHPRAGRTGLERPIVSFLFSGGVFRGVYQMGVLNALNLVGLRPDVIAGASVGSITAAMIARVFREPHEGERVARIGRLAATYLALDRLILTDRFADFVRGFTVRAAATRFSLSQADRVFRAFDKPVPGEFDRELRAVAAGLERLFYVSPFELKDLVEASRRRQGSKALKLLADYLQEWLGRMGVGNQVLGAEPLALLIADHVLEGLPGYSINHPGTIPFDVFTEDGICFLATATNLTQGRLEILGFPAKDEMKEHGPVLLDGLLASSAFPGVFRPRWSWEIMPTAETADQYIDGGVTDNLPLDAVAHFLNRAATAQAMSPRPGVPHLLLCASLEPEVSVLDEDEQQALRFNWPGLWRRAGQLGYNKKIDLYASIQRSIRMAVGKEWDRSAAWTPLDLEVVAIKPQWLCNTFAFHPMLHFRRRRQAQSIAHGCASTLMELARPLKDDRSATWKQAWGIDEGSLPEPDTVARPDPYQPLNVGPDECWFRSGVICPFSRTGMAQAGLLDATAREVESIYTLCGKPDTHHPSS